MIQVSLRKRAERMWDLTRSRNVTREIVNRIAPRPRRLLGPSLAERSKTPSAQRINLLMAACRGTDYLEIGVNAGRTFEGVHADRRVGVDPKPLFDLKTLGSNSFFHTCPSDVYFELNGTDRFALAFVDGLHEFHQAYRDLINSLNQLAPGGVVLVDDCVPSDKFSALRDPEENLRLRREAGLTDSPWHGDVFLAILAIVRFHPELIVTTTTELPHQSVVFHKSAPSRGKVYATPEWNLAELKGVRFEDLFSTGIPSEFGPRPFAMITQLVHDLNARS